LQGCRISVILRHANLSLLLLKTGRVSIVRARFLNLPILVTQAAIPHHQSSLDLLYCAWCGNGGAIRGRIVIVGICGEFSPSPIVRNAWLGRMMMHYATLVAMRARPLLSRSG